MVQRGFAKSRTHASCKKIFSRLCWLTVVGPAWLSSWCMVTASPVDHQVDTGVSPEDAQDETQTSNMHHSFLGECVGRGCDGSGVSMPLMESQRRQKRGQFRKLAANGTDDSAEYFTSANPIDVFLGSSKLEQPPSIVRSSMDVNITFVLMNVAKVDEASNSIYTFVDLELSWVDNRLITSFEESLSSFCETFLMDELYGWYDGMQKTNETLQACQVPYDYACATTKYDLEWYKRQFAKVLSSREGMGCSNVTIMVPHFVKYLFGEYTLWQQTLQRILNRGQHHGLTGFAWTPLPRQLRPGDGEKSETGAQIFMSFHEDIDIAKNGSLWATLDDSEETVFQVNLQYMYFPFDKQVLSLCLAFDGVVAPRFVEPQSIEKINTRAAHTYARSEMSPFVSQEAVDSLELKGYWVTGISTIVRHRGARSSACVELEVVRKPAIIIFRLFLPLGLLVVMPFVGLWLPVTAVMPRIATGFIPFLSLQVFRSMAYGMIPQVTMSLLWIDLVMIMCTEMMFLAVVHNIVAVYTHARVSNLASQYFDKIGKQCFGPSTIILGLFLAIVGGTRTHLNVAIIGTHLGIIVMGTYMALRMTWYIRNLPQQITQTLIKDLTDGTMSSRDLYACDRNELSRMFRFIDVDGSGNVTSHEILARFRECGLKFPSDEALKHTEAELERVCGLTSIYFDSFEAHYKVIFGHHMSRTLSIGNTIASESAGPATPDKPVKASGSLGSLTGIAEEPDSPEKPLRAQQRDTDEAPVSRLFI